MEPAAQEAMEALRRYVQSYTSSVLHSARHAELSGTEGNALGEIVWAERTGTPLTPTVLAARAGLTSGATTALINRLEARDLVVRSREHQDRRSVTLRSTPRARSTVDEFAARSQDALAAALEDYDRDQLVFVRDFIDRFAGILPGSDPVPMGQLP